MYKKTVLQNGLRVVTHRMRQRDGVSIGFLAGVGGRHEEAVIKGAAHFLEHIVFKGSRKYSCDQIKEKIEGVGGMLNAFTSDESTCFYAKVPLKHLAQSFDVLSDITFFPSIRSADVAKEKGVILEEIKMYHDLPQYYVMELADEIMWGSQHPLGQNLAGTFESVGAMSSRKLACFHDKFYAPNNVVMAVCGDVAHEEMVELAKTKLSALRGQVCAVFVPADLSQDRARIKFGKRSIEQMHLVLAMPGYDEEHKRRYHLSILNTILGGNMSSRLFNEVREKRGLAYSISSNVKYLKDSGVFSIRAGLDTDKMEQAADVILAELRKIRRKGITRDEFVRAREYVLGQLVLHLEDSMEQMLWMGDAVLSRDKFRNVSDVMKAFEKISVDQIMETAQDILNPRKYNLAVVGPLSTDHEKSLKALVGC